MIHRHLLISLVCFSGVLWAAEFATLTPSEASFAQQMGLNPDSVTEEQAAKAKQALKGRDPSTLTPAEIEMARQAVAQYSSKSQIAAASAAPQATKLSDIKPPPAPDTNESAFVKPTPEESRRYEIRFFSEALPSSFYEQASAVLADYPIKPADVLVLTLWGAVEKEYRLQVNNQGKVNVEGIGLVSIASLTISQAEGFLRGKLKQVYSGIDRGRIQVNLRPEALGATKVFVLGEVRRPGGYDLPANCNVFLALFRAQGPTERGSVRKIIVTRGTGDKDTIDLYDYLFRGIKSGQAILKDGDVVFIPQAEKLVEIAGDMVRPSMFELKDKEGLQTLLQFAGGARPTAAHTVRLW
ncbi:MAG TPA: SLBB domain-containing protein, partial [Fibrobacteraceae bacterium]|nr:SLBB domain-containing protein [Fibrobacteraceae bacterium]